tara:strand:- start:289 stop:750 length:462 start_codon:yes stop_codon:yes gene_type:complete
MTKLNTTKKVKINKIRVGRGIGSGKGKTSGRGVKGQKSRSGVAIKSFEGGQMPLFRRLPKRGFNPIKKYYIKAFNLNTLQTLLDNKTLNIDQKIDLNILKKNNIVSKKISKFKILGNGEISSKINLEVDYISKSAKEKLEKNGSTILVKSLKE